MARRSPCCRSPIRRFHAALVVIMVAHMPTRISLLWTVVLLTLPCPLFLVYCFAVVPPVAVLVLSANLIEQEALLGLAAAALMIGEVPRHRHRDARRPVAAADLFPRLHGRSRAHALQPSHDRPRRVDRGATVRRPRLVAAAGTREDRSRHSGSRCTVSIEKAGSQTAIYSAPPSSRRLTNRGRSIACSARTAPAHTGSCCSFWRRSSRARGGSRGGVVDQRQRPSLPLLDGSYSDRRRVPWSIPLREQERDRRVSLVGAQRESPNQSPAFTGRSQIAPQ